MTRATKILQLLEVVKEKTLYFGSSTQGMKRTLTPRIPKSAHATHARKAPAIYASDNKAYAAAFTFDWREKEGFEFGKFGEKGIYTLKVPHRYIPRLKKPCSLYTVRGKFTKLRTGTPEYISRDVVTIIKEKKYKEVQECLEKNGVRITVIQTSKRARKNKRKRI